jgi:rhodanese-related sulfurtransferase
MPDSISGTALRELLKTSSPPVVLDVRRPQAFAESPATISGADRRLPEEVDSWAGELPKDRPVVAYCVFGQQVSQGVVARLEQLGVKACFLDGGIEQWKAEGGPLSPVEPDSSKPGTSASGTSSGS